MVAPATTARLLRGAGFALLGIGALAPCGSALQRAVEAGSSEALERVLRLHERALGGPEILERLGDLEIAGRMETPDGRGRWRALVRREPFAVREELTQDPPAPGGGPRAEAPPVVLVCNGARAWRLQPDGSGVPLPAHAAILSLERAFFLGFRYLDREGRAADKAILDLPRSLEDWPGDPPDSERGRRVETVNFRTPAGTLWQCFFDAEDGRFHGRFDPFWPQPRWVRHGAWKEFGGLRFPALHLEGYPSPPWHPARTVVETIRTGLALPDALFGGDPLPARPALVDVARLLRARDSIPGSAHYAVADVRVNGTASGLALLDTGAESVVLDPALAQGARTLGLSPDRTVTSLGDALSEVRWIDVLEFGAERAIQFPATAAPFLRLAQFPRDAPPTVILGGEVLFGGSPVLDLAGERLLFRGKPFTPLAKVPKSGETAEKESRTVTVPFRRERPGKTSAYLDVVAGGKTLPVLLDTGIPPVLRLMPAGLRRIGLPADREEWMRRGAIPYGFEGAAGMKTEDLLVRLDAVSLGPIIFERPWVLLSRLGEEGEGKDLPFEGLLGGGALLPFARVGIDGAGERLELEPGPECELRAGGKIVVPDPGRYLGLSLEPPLVPFGPEPSCLPRIFEVSPGTAAARAGVRAGDYLVTLEGIPCAGAVPAGLYERLWPREGKSVALLLHRPGEGMVPVELDG